MITESDVYKNRPAATLTLAVLLSLFVNAVAWMIGALLWGVNLHLVLPNFKEPVLTVTSSSITLDRRVVPQPPRPITPPHPPQPHQAPQRAVAAMQAPQRQERPRPIVKDAVHPPTFAQTLAMQQQEFAKEATALHDTSHPLSVATLGPEPPSSVHKTYMDINGVDPTEHVEALLRATQHWTTDGLSCYYVHYEAQFSGGGNESGNIPWPICYPANHDAMLPLNRVHALPVPAPPPGFVLPPGTALSPLLSGIYRGTIHR